MGKKPQVRLRVYKGQKMSYDENGRPQNENQKVTLVHDTAQWKNYLKTLRANRFIKVDVEEVFYAESVKNEDGFFKDNITEAEKDLIETIEQEVKDAFELKTDTRTPEQIKIAELEAKINALSNGSAKVKDTKKTEAKDIGGETPPDDDEDIDALKAEYEKVVGKKPHHMAGVEKLKEGIANAKK